jgi:HD domain
VSTAQVQEPTPIRLAELVAALSLGVDLGFGQPMEHVLRQCLIALRIGEGIGLRDEERLVVYYTALLVNVGCHSDAHEQAKWFGDDIALKSGKYDHEQRGLAGAAAAMRLIGSGNPPLHRFRVGLEFAVSGHRDLNGMIARHSVLARTLAGQLGLPDAVQEAVGASYERWDGRGWPGDLKGAEIPLASRVAQIAEYAEVAQRVGGIDAAMELARKRSGSQFDPDLAALLCAEADVIFSDLESAQTWDAVIGAEPALGVRLSADRYDEALRAVANFVDLKSPYMLGHAAAVSQLAAAAGAHLGFGPAQVTSMRRAGLVHGLGRLGVSNSIWDKPGPLGAGEWERVRLFPYLTGGCCSSRLLWHRSGSRRPAAGAPRWFGLSAPAGGVVHLHAGPAAGRGGRLPVDARAPPASSSADAGGSRVAASIGREGGPPRCGRRGCRARCRRPPGGSPAPGPGRAHGPRDRRPPASGTGLVEQADRSRAGDLTQDGAQPHRAHLREDRRLEPVTASLFAMDHGLLPVTDVIDA